MKLPFPKKDPGPVKLPEPPKPRPPEPWEPARIPRDPEPPRPPGSLAQAIDVLERTPATLRALLQDIPAELARGTEGPDTFSPFDNIGHLIDGEETDWMPRARIILAQGPNRRFEPYDRFRHRARNAKRTLESLLDEFATLRAENLRILQSWKLSEAQLALPGDHPRLGPVTLRQLLAAWVVHDLGHIAQVARVMAKQYRTEVGPWVPFLPVLTDHEVSPG